MEKFEFFHLTGGTFRTPEHHPFRLSASKGFLCALTDEVALNLGGKPEGESQNLARNVIPKPVVVLDRPDPTAFVHADVEDLHDHEKVAAESGKFGADYEVSVPDLLEKSAEPSDRIITDAAYRLLNPAVYGDALSLAEPADLKSLVLHGLLVTAHSDVSIVHIPSFFRTLQSPKLNNTLNFRKHHV